MIIMMKMMTIRKVMFARSYS